MVSGAGTKVLGYEPLGFEAMSFHSTLCCGMTKGDPLKAEFDEALRVVNSVRDGKLAEPGIWLPWLVVQYELG